MYDISTSFLYFISKDFWNLSFLHNSRFIVFFSSKCRIRKLKFFLRFLNIVHSFLQYSDVSHSILSVIPIKLSHLGRIRYSFFHHTLGCWVYSDECMMTFEEWFLVMNSAAEVCHILLKFNLLDNSRDWIFCSRGKVL